SPSRERAVSAATAAAPAVLPDSTNAAVHAPSHEAKPHRAGGGALRWVGAGALVVLAGVGWFVTQGALRISWGQAPAPAAETARAAPAATSVPMAAGTITPSPDTAPAAPPASAAPAPSASASAASRPSSEPAASKPASPRVEHHHPVTPPSPGASPTAFRPKDL